MKSSPASEAMTSPSQGCSGTGCTDLLTARASLGQARRTRTQRIVAERLTLGTALPWIHQQRIIRNLFTSIRESSAIHSSMIDRTAFQTEAAFVVNVDVTATGISRAVAPDRGGAE